EDGIRDRTVTGVQTCALPIYAHPPSVDTFTDSRPPAASIVSRVRLRSNLHGAAAWLTATRCDPTTMAVERAAGAAFAPTVNAIVPSPCPFVVASETHADSAEAVHEQSRVVSLEIDPLPPAGGN